MIVTELTRSRLAHRRCCRDWAAEGYEWVGENGGLMWQLVRGGRHDHVITDVRIDPSGKSLWIKAEPATVKRSST